MGVIQRQGLKYTVLNFVGLVIGTASTLFVYSRQEVVGAYGLVQYLLSICMLSFPFLSLSAHNVSVRFFPHFQQLPKGREQLFFLTLFLPVVGWLLWMLVLLLGRWWWPPLRALPWELFPLALFYALGLIMTYYSSNRQRIVVPSLLFDLSLKIVLPLLMIALWLGWLTQALVLKLLLGHFALVFAALFFYLRNMGEQMGRLRCSILPASLRREVLRYSAFGVLSGAALLLATKADTFWVGTLTDMRRTGVYAIALNIAVAMDIPLKGLLTVSIPIMTQHLAQDNRLALHALYASVSTHLFMAGLFLFGCLAVAAGDLYRIMPNSGEVSEGKAVLLLLCTAKVVEMAMSLNSYLVYYSQHYRYALISLGVLALANAGFSLWVVPVLGISGAAWAVLLTTLVYQGVSAAVAYWKFGLQPFSHKTLWLVLFFGAAWGATHLLPHSTHPLENIAVQVGGFAAAFGSLILGSGISPEIGQAIRSFREKICHR